MAIFQFKKTVSRLKKLKMLLCQKLMTFSQPYLKKYLTSNIPKVYIGKVIKVDDTDANILFLTQRWKFLCLYISWTNLGRWNLGVIFKHYFHSASPFREEMWQKVWWISHYQSKRTLRLLEEEQLTFLKVF